MRGLLITLEGAEGTGKSTQSPLLLRRLEAAGYRARALREPGGTPISEEIRHTLKHSASSDAMTPEAELLLMNAARAQLVREVIRPALGSGEVVVCDRYYDSTVAYQGYGRGLNLAEVKRVIDFAVGETRPNLTLLFQVPRAVSDARRKARQAAPGFARDRFEEADRAFYSRVDAGFEAIAAAEPGRVRKVDGGGSVEEVHERVWKLVSEFLAGHR